MKGQYLDQKIKRIEHLTDYTTRVLCEEVDIYLNSTELGTYKNDNVKKLKKDLKEGQIIDVLLGEQGWAINTYPKRKAYYQEQTKFLNDETVIREI